VGGGGGSGTHGTLTSFVLWERLAVSYKGYEPILLPALSFYLPTFNSGLSLVPPLRQPHSETTAL
jgi:hypothetical protein